MKITDNKEACYAALTARDARFDGRIYTAVSSTGIYCRPVCRVQTPKIENCSFYPSAAAAEAAGYRPCLKCRPEMSPGLSIMDSSASIAAKAAIMMESSFISGFTIAEIADSFAVTARHFNRVFHAAHGVSPSSYLRSCRLLLAKRLLTDTGMSITDIAFAAGFGSVNRFNAQFKKYYAMPPSRLRKDIPKQQQDSEITIYQAYRPPYDWHGILGFLQSRLISGIDCVDGDTYRRSVLITDHNGKEHSGWLSVHNEAARNAVAVTISASLTPVISTVLAKVRLLFDLDCRPDLIEAKFGHLKGYTPGLRVPGAFDPFEMAVRTILGQQITVKAAATLAKRIADKFGRPIKTAYPELTNTFPQAETILKLDNIEEKLGNIGVISSRSRSIRAIAEALVSGRLSLTPGADIESTAAMLKSLPGIGDWSAQYILMRALGWPDAFLPTDYGVKKALPGMKPAEIASISKEWMPWRSYAMICLWRS